MTTARLRRVVAVVGGLLVGGALAEASETTSGGSSQLALPLLVLGLGIGLLFAALVRD